MECTKLAKPKPSSIFDWLNPKINNIITNCVLAQECLNPIYTCGYEIEITTQNLL